MITNEIFTIDWNEVPAEIVEALNSGRAGIFNGVARSTENYAIMKHMPFKPVQMDSIRDLAQVAQQGQALAGAVQMTVAISTAVTVGAVVLCTAYLASKLRELDSKIQRLDARLHGQNLIFYAEKAATYFAAVEATRELISTAELVEENRDLVGQSLSRLSGQRHETMAFLGNLCHLFDHLPDEDRGMALDFFHASLDFVPKAVLVESQAAYRLERFRLGDHVRKSAQRSYEECLSEYRSWGNGLLNKLTRGEVSRSNPQVLLDRLSEAKSLINNDCNRILLTTTI